MNISIRKRRRERQQRKNLLDVIALKKIQSNMLWSMETWGGTRCGGCGVKVRPHWLVNLSGPVGSGWITAFGYACDRTKCPGENPDWPMIEAEKLINENDV